ncbi:MAG: shikimate kinase [Salinivirgaceae bacterium]|nr:shikimate kinase [Salinivirgaceae bacterium]
MRIYLIGYMGSGKTTAGKKLANKLGYSFLDLDEFIEHKQQKSISEIFSKNGEAKFREIEHEALKATFSLTNTIISTGGGAPCFFNNMDLINQQGISIYVELNTKALAKRLKSAKQERPLIQGKTDCELISLIDANLEIRKPFYKQAQIIVNGIGLTAELLINEIEKISSF